MRLADLAGKRVAVWGFGREGRAAVAVLQENFPDQPVTLFCSEAEAQLVAQSQPADIRQTRALGKVAETSASPPIRVRTELPDAASLGAFDVVIKSPGISPYHAPYPQAEQAGVRFTSASALWFAEHPFAKTICITGTKGKSTVSALIAHLLRKAGLRVALAGNIGLPLLELLRPPIEPDWWVIELSSFQTRDFAGAPRVAVITNLYEEHLDWHLTREQYIADKIVIAKDSQCLVFNAAQSVGALQAAIDRLATARRMPFNVAYGWHVDAEAIWRDAQPVLPLTTLPLPGLHNAQNICAALTAIEAAGLDARALAAQVGSFTPLPHRLQRLGVLAGIDYVNDSISTTPYAAIEALRSFAARRVTILLGGFDRGLDWQPFVDFVAQAPPHAIVTMGRNGEAIAEYLRRIGAPGFLLAHAAKLDAAVALAQTLTPEHGLLLLSPGAPSFDQFHDYAERGREFARLAGFDPTDIAQIDGLGLA